jgi:hypothetical protein
MPTEPLEEDDDRPYAQRYEAAADNDEYQQAWPEHARMRTFGPGVGSIIVGFIGVLIGIVMATYLVEVYRKQFAAQREAIENRQGMNPQQKQQTIEVMKAFTDGIITGLPIYGGFTILMSVLTALSGVTLLRTKARWFAITMAVVNLMPCTVNFYFLPLSIWTLVVLNNAEVIAKMRGLRSPDDV